MRLRRNGVDHELPDGSTVADVVAELNPAGRTRGFAVAVNGAVVPRSLWSTTALRCGDVVEILAAVQGG
jgi:sulfur carrier protein